MKEDLRQKYTDAVIQRRGVVINETVSLERMIDYYIASYFCKKEAFKKELMELVISGEKLMYRNKVLVFNSLLQKNKNIDSLFIKTLIDDLQKIGNKRNIFAHSQIDNCDKSVNYYMKKKTITFISYKNKVTTLRWTIKEVNELLDLIYECSVKVNTLNTPK